MTELLSVDGLTVRFERPAAATQPPMLFIHGYFVDGVVWDMMMSYFAARGHPCYAVNLRGRSGSRPNTVLGRATIRDFADDAATVARSLEDKPIVVGHSMGGLLAQILGERDLARALVLFAPAPPRGIPVMTARLAVAQLPYLLDTLLSRAVVPN